MRRMDTSRCRTQPQTPVRAYDLPAVGTLQCRSGIVPLQFERNLVLHNELFDRLEHLFLGFGSEPVAKHLSLTEPGPPDAKNVQRNYALPPVKCVIAAKAKLEDRP